MRVLVLACFIMGLALILFALNGKEPAPARIHVRKNDSQTLSPHPPANSISPVKIFSVAKPTMPSIAPQPKRTVASKPSFTVEPAPFDYEKDPEKRDYIEEGVSLEDIEREKNFYGN